MRLFIALALIVGSYLYVLFHTTDIALTQAQHLRATYQYIGNHAEQIATGRPDNSAE